MTWALAKLQTKPVKLLEKIEAQAIPLLSSMDMHNCANLLWGFATLRYPPKELLQPMVTSMIDRGIISGAKPVEVADLSTALSVLAKPGEHAELLLTLANRAAPDGCLEGFSSRQIVKLLSVYTKLEAVRVPAHPTPDCAQPLPRPLTSIRATTAANVSRVRSVVVAGGAAAGGAPRPMGPLRS